MSQVMMKRAHDLTEFRKLRASIDEIPFWPETITHLYIKLEFKKNFESAQDSNTARRFLVSVCRAAIIAEKIVSSLGGFLLEIQGSLIHLAIVSENIEKSPEDQLNILQSINTALGSVFHDNQKRVQAWRMAVDSGRTMIVPGKIVHNDDDSLVSLSNAANRPAKYLNKQSELPLDQQELKRGCLAIYNRKADKWDIHQLMVEEINESLRAMASVVSEKEIMINSFKTISEAVTDLTDTPAPDNPNEYFGWVMRSDLDGFSKRVEECFDNDEELLKLAYGFRLIMDKALDFSNRHIQTLAQLPWAGDNYTAFAIFESKQEYDEAIQKQLVNLALDYDKEMRQIATDQNFGGWAYGIAGGNIHGNSNGNIYLAGVNIGDRRYLVGAGEGVGRSTQAFVDTEPDAQEMSVYIHDEIRIDESYRAKFQSSSGLGSSTYKKAKIDDLHIVRIELEGVTESVLSEVTSRNSGLLFIPTKPYYQ